VVLHGEDPLKFVNYNIFLKIKTLVVSRSSLKSLLLAYQFSKRTFKNFLQLSDFTFLNTIADVHFEIIEDVV